MSDFDFQVPLNKEDLQEINESIYYVRCVYRLDQLSEELNRAKEAARLEGTDFIFDHFPAYYSIFCHSEKVQIELISRCLTQIQAVCEQLCQSLDMVLEDTEIQEDLRVKSLNATKMLIYVYSNLIVLLENKIEMKKKQNIANLLKKKGGKNSKTTKDVTDDYDKMGPLNKLHRLLKKPINKLWDPPICEESFINLIAEVCYVFLQNPTIKTNKEMQNLIFKIFGVLLKNYNYSLTFTIRIVQLAKSKENEHLPPVISSGVYILVEKYNCRSLVRELVRELTEWQTNENIQDAPGTKFCSQILIDMTVQMPELMIPEVLYLVGYLNHESHTLRCGVMTILTEVVIKTLSTEGLDEDKKEVRDLLLKQLNLHISDVNAHVRSKVLQLWLRMVTESAIPVDLINTVFEKAVGRLKDRAVLVRKQAIILVCNFIECNLYSSTLKLEPFENNLQIDLKRMEELQNLAGRERLENIKKKEEQWSLMEEDVRTAISNKIIQATQDDRNILPLNDEVTLEDIQSMICMYLEGGKYEDAFMMLRAAESRLKGVKERRHELQSDNQIEYCVMLLHSIFCDIKNTAVALIESELNRLQNLTQDQLQDIEKISLNVKFGQDAVNFIKIIQSAIPLMVNLLKSAVVSDIAEAVEFFVVARNFQVDNYSEGLTVMLDVLKTNDKDRNEIVTKTYKKMFLQIDEPVKKELVLKKVHYITNLLKSVNPSIVDNFGCIIAEWVKSGDLDNSVIEHLWSLFTKRLPDTSDEDSRIALQILSYAASGRVTIIQRNINLVAEIAFGERGMNDLELVIIACKMLGLMEEKVDVDSNNPAFCINVKDPMWNNLLNIMEQNFLKKLESFSDLSVAAVGVIYKICNQPSELWERLIFQLLSILKSHPTDYILTAEFIYLLGEIALKYFRWLDVAVYKELKRRNNIREKRQQTKVRQSKLNLSKVSASSRTIKADDGSEYMEGALAEDTDAEFILNTCEKEIVNANLLGQFVPMFISILEDPKGYNDHNLQAATALTMMRFMVVSSKFCEKHLRFMITILERTAFREVKINILVHMGDLFHRFPNVVEPWSSYLYKCVRDPELSVRLIAITVITMLISQDMMRVRGTIADIALCIVDESKEVVAIATNFFKALSQKGNTIYNVLPDIISRLSYESVQVEEEVFRKVLMFLIKLIDKDRQIEPLVEKLCLRFNLTDKPRQWRDIAFCILNLNHNEKSLQKLIECYSTYKNIFENDEVYELFISIVQKYKNAHKEEIKNVIRRFDLLLKHGETNEIESQEVTTEKETKKKSARGSKQKRIKSYR